MKSMKMRMAMLALCLFMTAECAHAASSPLLYRVEGEAGRVLYLLGTVHVGREDIYPLGPAVQEAWKQAEVLALEADPLLLQKQPALALQYTAAMRYASGDEAKNHLSETTYALGVKHLGVDESTLNRLRPMAWASLAESAAFARLGCSAEHGVDRALAALAREEGKQIVELEGAAHQIALMQQAPDDAVDALLADMLADPQGTDDSLRRMIDAWQAGDAERLTALIEADQRIGEDVAGAAAYNELLYFSRNERFARRAIEWLESDVTVLIAVGAAHVLGAGGLVDLLGRAGYVVTEIGR